MVWSEVQFANESFWWTSWTTLPNWTEPSDWNSSQLKGYVHRKLKIMSITPMSLQTCKTFVHLRNTNSDLFDEIWELSEPPWTATQVNGLVFFFFAYKNHFPKIKIEHQMSHWLFYQSPCYVSGSGNIAVVLLSMQGLRVLRFNNKSTLICVPNMNKVNEGELIITALFYFLGELTVTELMKPFKFGPNADEPLIFACLNEGKKWRLLWFTMVFVQFWVD